MNESLSWSRERADLCVELLRTSASYREGLSAITEWVGQPLTSDALRNAFRRLGYDAPVSYVGRDVAPAAETRPEPSSAERWPVSEAIPAATAAPLAAGGGKSPMAGDDYGLDPILFLPDTHRPYHDERAFQLALRVGHNLRRRYANRKMRIVILGDWGDYYCTSRHSKDPNRSRDLRFEIESCKAGLREVDAIGADEKHFVAGNHEDNLARYLMEKAPELFNMIKVEELLDLARTGWSYTPYKHHLRVGKLYITHETGFAGATAHTRSLADIGHNTVIGHTHRSSVSYTSNVLGESLVAAMFGWLGDRQKAEYMHRVKTRDWQLGVGVGFMEPSGVVHLKPVPFINYRAEVAGELVVG